ncbi:hypothetical protein FHS18_004766 [Paenibacillus phyllosphaerae]|uniref:Calcineurin-like phosphoesterase domain-containing protein n=1 Tax=Paenibacillus phyllosphaerae TaxID=274593 RepID=A0A7W5B1E1_9BACL|nr:metallophosphoesterase [Paenibacillus phyllosphaerae]MBB3112665.1 hypothetical protein [Paenibacillus phyllosphaerae]
MMMAFGIGAASLLLLLVIVRWQTCALVVREYRIEAGVDKRVTLVQLSDLHGRTRYWGRSLEQAVRDAKADVLCVTGDLASNGRQFPRVLKLLEHLPCRHKLFVPGNYEVEESRWLRKRRLTDPEAQERLDEAGKAMEVLVNRGVLLDLEGTRLYVYGFDNSIYGREAWTEDPSAGRKADATILLAHSPSVIARVESLGLTYKLLLAGHTHGGQIRLFGRTFGAYRHFHCGMKEQRLAQWFHISPGLGTVKIPIRWRCRPEVTVFRLVPAGARGE